jgi:ABC-type nitrate/sulfonate/bicarbonate transport system substrate-binding protein
MTSPSSDAFVFFGATGDLAYRKIFPALQAMIRRGELDIPIVGVARPPWSLDALRERARRSLEDQGEVDADVFAKLCAQLRYVAGAEQPLSEGMAAAIRAGYERLEQNPRATLGDLLAANPGLDRAEQQAQLDALLAVGAFSPPGALDLARLGEWAEWDLEHGLLTEPIEPAELVAR